LTYANDEFKTRYIEIDGEKPSLEVFELAMTGYDQIIESHATKEIITIIDFSLPSSEKRLWVIDLKNNKTLFFTHVAHGRNTGNLFATYFSDQKNSNKSSLGFYLTGESYYGRNGFSLRLDGLEPGLNLNARSRAIVMHGAWYADASMIAKTGRLGRSSGCPSVPLKIHKALINTIMDVSVLYIYHPDVSYFEKSDFFN
jgi:hypothetical protein